MHKKRFDPVSPSLKEEPIMIGDTWSPPSHSYQEDLLGQYAAWGLRSARRSGFLGDTVQALAASSAPDAPGEICRLLLSLEECLLAAVWASTGETEGIHLLANASVDPLLWDASAARARGLALHAAAAGGAVVDRDGATTDIAVPVWGDGGPCGIIMASDDGEDHPILDVTCLEDVAAALSTRWGVTASGPRRRLETPNRGSFAALGLIAEAIASEPKAVAVLTFRLVNMRSLQAAFGHAEAMARPQRLRDILSSLAPHTAWHCTAGDEVTGIAPQDDLHDDDGQGTLARRVSAAAALEGMDVVLGVALYPEDGGTPQSLLRHASLSIDTAGGGSRLVSHGSGIVLDALRERSEMVRLLHDAVAQGEIVAHFQPIIDISQRRVVGAEALARWHSRKYGMIMPSLFIPLIERLDRQGEMFQEMLRQTTEALTRAGRSLPLRISINATALQFTSPCHRAVLVDALRAAAEWRGALAVEITEQTVVADYAQAARTARELHDLGVPIYVDDFGTGFSSLSHIHRLPLDCIKIDRAFVKELSFSDAAVKVTRAIIALANAVGADVIAEGVETNEELDILLGLGCHRVQGFMFSRPLPVDEFLAFTAAFNTGLKT